MDNDLVVQETPGALACIDHNALIKRAEQIKNIKNHVMVEDVHYGLIPGCGDKKALLKEGAEVLLMSFMLVPKIYTTYVDLSQGHREYTTTCEMNDNAGNFLGISSACCSTMESKYRYNSEVIGQVPAEYWKIRYSDPVKAKKLLGGGDNYTKKRKKEWVVLRKIENTDIADVYNTCRRISEKRALIAETRIVLACSDLFTEEGSDDHRRGFEGDEGQRTTKPAQSPPQSKSNGESPSSEQLKKVWAMLHDLHPQAAEDEKRRIVFDILEKAEVGSFSTITSKEMDFVIKELGKRQNGNQG